MRSSSNIYNLSLMASIIARDGYAAGEDWARGVVANFARGPEGNDTSQIRSVAAGECDITLINTYYLARMSVSADPEAEAIAAQVGVIFPNQETTGTHVNVSGGGLLKHAPHPDAALALMEYLSRADVQARFSASNDEYPVNPDGQVADAVQALGTFRADDLEMSSLGRYQADAVRAFDAAGWR